MIINNWISISSIHLLIDYFHPHTHFLNLLRHYFHKLKHIIIIGNPIYNLKYNKGNIHYNITNIWYHRWFNILCKDFHQNYHHILHLQEPIYCLRKYSYKIHPITNTNHLIHCISYKYHINNLHNVLNIKINNWNNHQKGLDFHHHIIQEMIRAHLYILEYIYFVLICNHFNK